MENGYVESLNGRFHDALSKAWLFSDLVDARKKTEAWRRYYNGSWPHGARSGMTPTEFAEQRGRGVGSFLDHSL